MSRFQLIYICHIMETGTLILKIVNKLFFSYCFNLALVVDGFIGTEGEPHNAGLYIKVMYLVVLKSSGLKTTFASHSFVVLLSVILKILCVADVAVKS